MKNIVLCGPYSGAGHKLLTQLAAFLRSIGLPVYLCAELHPAEDPENPECVRRASHACLASAAAVVFVFLSTKSLGLRKGVADITGGVGWEVGAIYQMCEEGGQIHVGFLFDGENHRKYLSKMLQGRWQGAVLEAVVRKPGNRTEIRALLAQLCMSLLEQIRGASGPSSPRA
jgi:hypothetical protein